jgi:ATP-dependent DNA helicase RecG
MYTISQLKLLKESEDKIEFKEAAQGNLSLTGGNESDVKKKRRCILGYVSAFANEGGGTLVFGIADKYPHAVVGSNQHLGAIGVLESDIYRHLGIRVTAYELYEQSKRVLVLEIPSRPIGKILKYEDVALMRVGEDLLPMSEQKYASIINEQEGDFSAETVSAFNYLEIDEIALAKLKQAYASKQRNERFLTLSKIQIIGDLGLSKEGRLTYAALILLGTETAIKKYLPQASVIFEYRSSDSTIPFEQRREFTGPYYTMIDELWKQINQRNSSIPVQENAFIFGIPSFNEEVIRESINNAIAHRDYRKQSEVLVKQYSHSLIITNPGGFPLGVNLQNLLTVNSTPRNRLLAEVLQKTGAVERSGQGIDKIYYNCISEAKGEPDYNSSDDYQVSLKLSSTVEDKAFALFIKQTQQELQPEERLSLKEIITLNEVRKGTEKEKLDKAILQNLINKRLIETIGKTRSRVYILSKNYYTLTDQRGHYARSLPLNESEVMMLLQSYFAQYPSAKMKDFEGILGEKLTRNQIKYSTNKLVERKILNRTGVGRNSSYTLGEAMQKNQKMLQRIIQLGIQEMQKKGELPEGVQYPRE